MLLHSKIIGEGQPFIILHGFLGMSDNWKTLAKQFIEQGFQVHLVDQRNHGRSFWDEEFNYNILAKDLKHYCDTYNLEDVVLLGHSMGGKTAMLFATQFPEIVSKLLIADISPRFYQIHHQSILYGLQAINFDAIKSRSEADTVLSNYVFEPGTRQFLLKNLYWKEKEQLAFRMNLKVLNEQVSAIGEALPENSIFEKDTLFLRGDKSGYIESEDEVLIENHFPKSKIVTIKNSGHWLHAENPKDFFKAVMQFVR